jgi:integrase
MQMQQQKQQQKEQIITEEEKRKTKEQIWNEITDRTFIKFKNSSKTNVNTRRGLFGALDRYKTWKEQEQHRKLSYDELVVGDKETVEDNIESFMTYERDVKKLGHSMRQKSTTALKKFFRKNRVALSDGFWEDIREAFFEKQPEPTPVPYEPEQIREILDHCDLKYRAIILLLKDTSFRSEVVHKLRLGHLHRICIGKDSKGDDIFIFRIGPIFSKTREFYPFCTPETFKEIMKYLTYREKMGEKIDWGNPRAHTDTRKGNAQLANSGSWLFRNDSELNKKSEFEINNPQPFSPKSNGTANVIANSGVRIPKPVDPGKQPDYETPTVHGLREFTINRMKKVEGAHIEKQMCLTGHAIDKSRKHYASYTQEELLEEFIKCIPLLTVTEVAIKENELIKEREERMREKSKWESNFDMMKSQMLDLRSEIDKLREGK